MRVPRARWDRSQVDRYRQVFGWGVHGPRRELLEHLPDLLAHGRLFVDERTHRVALNQLKDRRNLCEPRIGTWWTAPGRSSCHAPEPRELRGRFDQPSLLGSPLAFKARPPGPRGGEPPPHAG